MTVGEQLLNEIERVSAKRERWRGYQTDAEMRASFAPAIGLMTLSINRAKGALASNDVVECIAALKDLQEWDGDD